MLSRQSASPGRAARSGSPQHEGSSAGTFSNPMNIGSGGFACNTSESRRTPSASSQDSGYEEPDQWKRGRSISCGYLENRRKRFGICGRSLGKRMSTRKQMQRSNRLGVLDVAAFNHPRTSTRGRASHSGPPRRRIERALLQVAGEEDADVFVAVAGLRKKPPICSIEWAVKPVSSRSSRSRRPEGLLGRECQRQFVETLPDRMAILPDEEDVT